MLRLSIGLACVFCTSATAVWGERTAPPPLEGEPIVRIVHLADANPDQFTALKDEFEGRNPGYSISFQAGARRVDATEGPRVVFVQSGEAEAVVGEGSLEERSTVTTGDLIALRAGDALTCDGPLDVLVFGTPSDFHADIPRFVRPDWDDQITDTPGGCATETGAYRRVCLTWLPEKGAYNYHSLNAHRVRITDSFSHYHPLEGGFDEFYLVQMVQPGAKIIVSDQTERIEHPEGMTRDEAAGLVHEYELRVGDLVYLPRGVMHRGFGGVLAQVIATPGFMPGKEIGVDHHLRAINEMLGLDGDDALPFHLDASE